MRYFILTQEMRLPNAIKLEDMHTHERYVIDKKYEKDLNNLSNIYVEGKEDGVYPDLIEFPVLIVSEKVKKLFEIFEPTMISKTTVLTHVAYEKQAVYFLTLLDNIECLSDKTTYLKNGWDDKLVLNKEKIQGYNLFYVKSPNQYYLVASFDLVEAILKRGFMGINIKEVEVI